MKSDMLCDSRRRVVAFFFIGLNASYVILPNDPHSAARRVGAITSARVLAQLGARLCT